MFEIARLVVRDVSFGVLVTCSRDESSDVDDEGAQLGEGGFEVGE